MARARAGREFWFKMDGAALQLSRRRGCTAITNQHGANVPNASNGGDWSYPSRIAFICAVCTMKTTALQQVADVSRAYLLSNEDG